MSALSGAQHLASSGRTSFPVDKALPRDAYRVLGYRQCGERAVRVDILERLADLIRPALAWREASPGEKPAGAFDGRGFVVTQAMTSLTGSAGEDFASILRALGYRMDKRPPLPPKPVAAIEPVAAEAAPAEGPLYRGRAEAAVETPAEAAANACSKTHGRAGRNRCRARGPAGLRRPRAVGGVAARSFADAGACRRAAPAEEAAAEAAPEAVEAAPEPEPWKRQSRKRWRRLRTDVTAAVEAQRRLMRRSVSEVTETAAASDAAPADAAAAEAAPDAPARLNWWKSGGPAAVRKSAVRTMTATATVIMAATTAAREGAAPAAAAGEGGEAASGASSVIAAAAVTMNSAKPREGAPVEAGATPPAEGAPAPKSRGTTKRVPTVRRANALKARARDKRQRGREKFGGDRDKGDRNKGDRDRGGRDKGRDFGGRDKARPR